MKRENKIFLLKLARASISDYFDNIKTSAGKITDNELSEKSGCFVTLEKDGDLRGCIGYIEGVEPIYSAVIRMAREAAFNDPRFFPLSREDFDKIEIEISVLTPLVKVKSIEEINVPGDGLLIRSGYNSGLLLPQVAVDWGYDRKQFLAQTCLKAGLDRRCFLSADAKIYKFQAEIFSEKEFLN
jgi:AmmeMemoRadiSam system protein A